MDSPEHSWVFFRGGFHGQGVRFHASTGDTRHKTLGKIRGQPVILFNTVTAHISQLPSPCASLSYTSQNNASWKISIADGLFPRPYLMLRVLL